MLFNVKGKIGKNSNELADFLKCALAIAISLIGFFAMFNVLYNAAHLSNVTSSGVGYNVFGLFRSIDDDVERDITYYLGIFWVILAVFQLMATLLVVLHVATVKKGKKSHYLNISVIISLVLHALSLIIGAIIVAELAKNSEDESFLTKVQQPMIWAILLFSLYLYICIYQDDKKDILAKTAQYSSSPMTNFYNLTTLGALFVSATSLLLPIVQMVSSMFRGFDITFWLSIPSTGRPSEAIAIIAIFFAIIALALLVIYVFVQYFAKGNGRSYLVPMVFNSVAIGVNLLFTVMSMVLCSDVAANSGILKVSTYCFVPLVGCTIVLIAQLMRSKYQLAKSDRKPEEIKITEDWSFNNIDSSIEGKYEV